MEIQQNLNPNCSEYVLSINIPAEDDRHKKLEDMLTMFSSSDEGMKDTIEELEGIKGIFDTSFWHVSKSNNGKIIIDGYLNQDGLLAWLDKHGYQYTFNGDR